MKTISNYTGKISIRREYLNSQGYTRCGVYFGVGLPLYFVQDEDGEHAGDGFGEYIRAADRESAVFKVRKYFPLAQIRN